MPPFNLGNINPMAFAQQLIKNNPAIVNNPNNAKYIDALQSGDPNKIAEVGNEILSSHGLTQEQAMNDVSKWLNLPMQ